MEPTVESVNADLRAGREVTVEESRLATLASVHELAPLVVADPPVPVEVWDPWTKDWYPGHVRAWRGPRVSVEYSRGPGMKHLVWLPADAVRRVQGGEGVRTPVQK